MPTIHKEHRRDYITIPTALIRDSSLSWGARGFALAIADRPNWQMPLSEIPYDTRHFVTELENAGYATVDQVHDTLSLHEQES